MVYGVDNLFDDTCSLSFRTIKNNIYSRILYNLKEEKQSLQNEVFFHLYSLKGKIPHWILCYGFNCFVKLCYS